MELRPYQLNAIENVRRELVTHRSTLVVMPTASGKTVVFAKIAELYRQHGRVLVLAHREELLRQAQAKIQQWTQLNCGIEQAEKSVSGMFLPDVTIASVQTLSRPNRLTKFVPNTFALIIIDEAHHAVSSSYLTIFRYFAQAKLCGVTATPDRLDKKGMGAIFETSAYVYEIRDAIEAGYLCPLKQKAVTVESLDLSKVRTTAGDLNEADLEAAMMEERPLHEVAQPTVELAEERPTLVFSPTVKHAYALAEVINRYKPGSAAAIDGKMDSLKRQHVFTQFIEGETQFLCNVGIATEGVDIPPVACVAMARPTKSRALYTQCAGRGLRLHPSKDDCLILDYVGNSGKHALISALDVLDGNTDLEVKIRAQQLCNSRGNLTILQALDEAAHELAEEKRTTVLAKAKFHTVDVDPFTVLGIHPRAGRWGGQPLTEKQAQLLEKAGIPYTGLDKGQASEVIDKIFSRRKQGLCTVKMAKTLMKFGFEPDISFEKAKRQLDAIAQSGWRLTLAQHEQIAKLAA